MERTRRVIGFLEENRWRILAVLGLVLWASSTAQNDYRSVSRIAPEVLQAPVQKEIKDPEVIHFQNEDGIWELTPLDDYEINGLLVSKLSYDQPTLFHVLIQRDIRRHAWPFDLVLIWGSNVSSGVYKQCEFFSDVSFGGRTGNVSWKKNGLAFNMEEFSNNHLIISRDDLKRKAASLVIGDQIRIKGKLVRFKLKVLDKDKKTVAFEDAGESSRIRTDQGCEIIYVEDIRILRGANLISRTLFRISKFGFTGMILFIVLLWLFREIRFFMGAGAPPS